MTSRGEDYIWLCFKRSIGECTYVLNWLRKGWEKHEAFTGSEEGAETSSETAGFESVIAQGKDIVSRLKVIRSRPVMILCPSYCPLQENVYYDGAHPSSTEMEVDQDFIYISQRIFYKSGAYLQGKVSFILQQLHLAMTVTDMQFSYDAGSWQWKIQII